MSCPYFFPVQARTLAENPRHTMLPLGGYWTGNCMAPPASAGPAPDETTQRALCNLGYARGYCPRFGDLEIPDAVRFSISADDGTAIRICYVMERDHHPFAHGQLEYSRAYEAFREPPSDAVMSRQAQAYIESYVRRIRDAGR